MSAGYWPCQICGAKPLTDGQIIHDSACTLLGLNKPTLVPLDDAKAFWMGNSGTIAQDSAMVADSDLEMQVLAKCVYELNRLVAVDKEAASRVVDYLADRFQVER